MNPLQSSSQLQLDFVPGLSERYPTVLECIRACVYSNAKPIKSIAGDMDMSPSDLSRKLSGNPDDPRRFSVGDLEHYVSVTGDTTPIQYLVQKYCADAESRKRVAIAEIAHLAPLFASLLKEAGASLP